MQSPQDFFKVIIKIYSPTRTQPTTLSAPGAWHRERRTSNTPVGQVVGGFLHGRSSRYGMFGPKKMLGENGNGNPF